MLCCVGCSSFDPYYKGGYCDYHQKEVSPYDTCPYADARGSHEEYDDKKICGTCDCFSWDRGGWCDCHKCTTNFNSYCRNYR